MTVKELIKELQQLPEEFQDSGVLGEYREFRGPLDLDGVPCSIDFCSIRTEDNGRRGKRKQCSVVLY